MLNLNETKSGKLAPHSETRKGDKLSHEFYIDNNQLNFLHYKHRTNRINTTKYNILNFLPKALLFQLSRIANVYFIFIAIIQTIPYISPISPITAWAPIIVVLCVSIIREAIEDIARYKYDKIQNNMEVTVYRNNQWMKEKSGNLHIGEIVLVKQNNVFPADMILVDSNLKEGLAYIETRDGNFDFEFFFKTSTSNSKL